MKPTERELAVNSRWADIAQNYNTYRMSPPTELIEWIIGLSGNSGKPERVVDIGCGTGLSTKPWGKFAKEIIGIDPSDELLTVARQDETNSNITFIKGTGAQTTLEDKSVDILTAVHSTHWMEPDSTTSEIRRILKESGSFAMYQHSLAPVSKFMILEKEHFKLKKSIGELVNKYCLDDDYYLNNFEEHLNNRNTLKLLHFCRQWVKS